MANANVLRGLQPLQNRDGSSWNGQVRPYFIPSSYATALFVGDPVVKTGTSNTAAAGLGGQYIIGSLPEINKATAGNANAVTGVIIGFEEDPNNLERIYNPASTERVAYVCDDPNVIYEIQGDVATAVAATDIGANAELIYTNSGSTTTGLSGAELDVSTTAASDAASQLKILRLVNREDNEIGINAKLEVLINNTTEDNNIAGV